jgi:hypothetical protein
VYSHLAVSNKTDKGGEREVSVRLHNHYRRKEDGSAYVSFGDEAIENAGLE